MLPQRLEAVLFDAGGTLVNLDYRFIANAAQRRGAAVDVAALPRADAQARLAIDRAARGDRTDQGDDASRQSIYFETLLRAGGVDGTQLSDLVAEIRRAHRERNLWRVLQPGAAESLRGLRTRGVRTAVVSNADGRIEATLVELGLAAHLDLVVDSHLEGVEKPDPEIFRRALLRLDVRPERCVYVGDIYSIDVLGARAAGLEPVIIDPTGSYGELDCPVIAALSELVDALGPRE